MATVFVDVKHDEFGYVVDGRLVSSFCLYAYSLRHGAVSDPLLADVRALGLDRDDRTDEAVAGALALADRATRVRPHRADLVRPSLSGRIASPAGR